MKYLVAALLLLLSASGLSAQAEMCTESNELCVVYFNASFNAANEVTWLGELSECTIYNVDILKSPDLQKEHKIVVVPTILILDDGVEVARFQANIMMTMEATREEVQESIDEIIMSKF